jgi:fumarylacetoacetase
VVAYGEQAVDLWAAWRAGILADHDEGLFAAASLNPLAAAGRSIWQAVRGELGEALRRPAPLPRGVLVPRAALEMRLPVEVGDYVDGYGGIHHATNAGRIVRPGSEPLAPNWRHMPVAYHGRASTVVASGTPVRRPLGQLLVEGRPVLRPTACLDFELEVGFVVGPGTNPGQPLRIEEAAEHIFGLVLVNDWSARDVQALESRPLGPYLSKSFATSVSVWVVTLEALRPYLVAGLAGAQRPEPPAYLRSEEPWIPDLHLEVALQTPAMARARTAPVTVSKVEYAEAMYWSMAQQLVHATVNGASVRPGDLFASGTASGPDPATAGGSLLELTWGGTRPLELPGGERRTFLEDGDTVVLRGLCGGGSVGQVLSMGEVVATVAPAPDHEAATSLHGERGGAPAAPGPA